MKEKVDKYFKLLHPENKEESGTYAQLVKDNEYSFMKANISEILEYYNQIKEEDNNKSETEIIKEAVKAVKVEKFFEVLYPEFATRFKTMASDEKNKSMKDYIFISENIESIDARYLFEIGAYAIEGFDENKTRMIIESLKLEKEISTVSIGQATKDVSITTKKSVQQVEETERGRENTNKIGGEKVGDDS